jgi:acyl dehydratase
MSPTTLLRHNPCRNVHAGMVYSSAAENNQVKRSMELIFFEEIEVPSRVDGPSQIIDRDEMVDFAKTWDPLPIHLDEDAARAYGGLTASGPYLLAFRILLIHRMERQPAVIASLGYEEVRFKAPAHAGDKLRRFLDFEKKRMSSSKADRGVVTIRQSLINQDGKKFLTVVDTLLVRKKSNDNS